MSSMYLFDKVTELKDKLHQFFQQKKRLSALMNYAEVSPCQHFRYLTLLNNCMNDGFLGDKEADFLNYMVDKYFDNENYLNWSHKTKWLRKEMERKKEVHSKPKENQLVMNFVTASVNRKMPEIHPGVIGAHQYSQQQAQRRI